VEKISEIYSKFICHNNRNLYYKYIRIRVGCLTQFVHEMDGDKKMYYKLMVHNYFETEYGYG